MGGGVTFYGSLKSPNPQVEYGVIEEANKAHWLRSKQLIKEIFKAQEKSKYEVQKRMATI
jgi:hypothetical protein